MKSNAINLLIMLVLSGIIFSCKPKSDVGNSEKSELGCNINYTAIAKIVKIKKASRTDTSNMFSVYPIVAEIKIEKILKKARTSSEEMKENAVLKVFFTDFERAFRSENPLAEGDNVRLCLEYRIPESYHHVSWFVSDFEKFK
jgi:hypothetical protein